MTLKIVVLGLPVTQGSKTGFVVGKRAVVVDGGSEGARMRFKDWRHAVRSEAQRAVELHGLEEGMWDGPVAVTCDFRLLKPASAPKRRRTWPIGARSGDLDKLERLVYDALTGVVFSDDAHVVENHNTKDYGVPGVEISVSTVGEGST